MVTERVFEDMSSDIHTHHELQKKKIKQNPGNGKT